MEKLSRRSFLKTAAVGAAALSFSAKSWSQIVGANSDIRVAQIGFHSQGRGHISTLRNMRGVRMVALCDVDKHVLDGMAQTFNGGIQTYTDIRKLLENKDVDAVSIAVPNHWHALATVWACQAGKDVYVEKPACHNIFEGRQMAAAARKYGRIVQCGTQCRSSVGLQQAAELVHSGKLGKIILARGFCYKSRPSIGLCGGPQQVPDYIDYDIWCGPAPKVPPHRNNKANGPVHYDWHWFWAYGNGDYGNQGPHQVDICRWFLGEPEISPFAMAVGGRLGYKDDAETPNTLTVYQGYEKAPMIFEVRGLPQGKGQPGKPQPGMDSFKLHESDHGVGVGNVIECEDGYVVIPSYTEAYIYDKGGKLVQSFPSRDAGAAPAGKKDRKGGKGNRKGKKGAPAAAGVTTPTGLTAESGGHHGNWIAAIRSRKPEMLHAEILEGHLSAGLVHTGNISYRLGATMKPEEIKEKMQDSKFLMEAYERMCGHLEKNGVDVSKNLLTMGMPVKFDPKKEKFVGNKAADKLLSREYRAPFIVPKEV